MVTKKLIFAFFKVNLKNTLLWIPKIMIFGYLRYSRAILFKGKEGKISTEMFEILTAMLKISTKTFEISTETFKISVCGVFLA